MQSELDNSKCKINAKPFAEGIFLGTNNISLSYLLKTQICLSNQGINFQGNPDYWNFTLCLKNVAGQEIPNDNHLLNYYCKGKIDDNLATCPMIAFNDITEYNPQFFNDLQIKTVFGNSHVSNLLLRVPQNKRKNLKFSENDYSLQITYQN